MITTQWNFARAQWFGGQSTACSEEPSLSRIPPSPGQARYPTVTGASRLERFFRPASWHARPALDADRRREIRAQVNSIAAVTGPAATLPSEGIKH